MAKAQAVSLDDLIQAALVKLATNAEGTIRLKSSKGKDDGLFPDSAGGKQAIELATTGGPPLVGTEKRGVTPYGRLTPAGVAKVCEYLEGDAAGTLLLRLVEQKSEADKGKFLEEVYLHLGERSAGVRASYSAAADRRNQQAFQKQRKVKIEQLRGVIAEREAACGELRGRVTLIEMEIGGLNHLLEKLNAATPPGQEGNVDRPKPVNDPLPRPATADVARLNDQIACLQKELHDARAKPPVGDHSAPQPAGAREFMREQAERLVAVWNDQAGGDPAGRQSLETAMRTMRTLEQIGPEQTRVAFNARYHACPVPISTGAAATVTRSGWKLQEAEGREYVLLKATVTPGG